MLKAETAVTNSGGADIEDIDPETMRESFNRIVRVAVELLGGLGGEVAIRRRGQVWRSSGRAAQHTPIASLVEASADALWIEDWTKDPRVDSRLVADDVRGCRFYVGAPIRLRDGCWGCCPSSGLSPVAATTQRRIG